MVRTVSDGFREFAKRLTPTAAQRTAGATHRASVESALKAKLDIYRVFESGSASHGTGVRGYSDTDAFVILKGDRPASSYTALQKVKEALDSRFTFTPVKIRRPAVVVEFAGGFETWEIIPAYITGRGGVDHSVYDIPGPTAAAGWIDSAPRSHLNYVNEQNKSPEGAVKELTRFIKAWKYYQNVPISSFYLEMRCAKFMSTISTYVPVWDLSGLLTSLKSHQLAPMNDPSGATGQIHACSSDATRKDALSKLSTAERRAASALSDYKDKNDESAYGWISLLYNSKFPSRYF